MFDINQLMYVSNTQFGTLGKCIKLYMTVLPAVKKLLCEFWKGTVQSTCIKKALSFFMSKSAFMLNVSNYTLSRSTIIGSGTLEHTNTL
jgi:hypothetical protein